MKKPVFTGAGVAIITPMYEDGSINFDELGRIIEDQIARHRCHHHLRHHRRVLYHDR